MSYAAFGRRHFLQYLAAGAGAVWFGGGWEELKAAGHHAATVPDGASFQALTAHEASVLEAMSERIIPTDDTPGAKEARVVRFMDQALSTYASSVLPLVRQGIVELDAEVRRRFSNLNSFTQLQPAAQIRLLEELDSARSPFFETVRIGTFQGMFANPEYGGNFEKTGWKLIGFEDRFIWQAPFGDYDK